MAIESGKLSPPLTERASAGFLWLLIQAISSKAAGFIGQLILARLLVPRDFGMVALAYSVATVPKLLRDNGLLQILIGKQSHLEKWVSSVFWFDLALGFAGTVALAAAAPFCAVFFHQPELRGLIWLVASGMLVNAMTSVPMAKLYTRLDFKRIAIVGSVYNLGVLATTVALAWLGFGAYSLLIPLPIFSAVRLGVFWAWAPSRIHRTLGILRWCLIAKDAFPLAASSLVYALQTALPSVALSRIRTVAAAGVFYFGWNLSTQALQLLSFNLGQVLLPVLAGLRGDPPRQAAAFLRVLRLTVFVSAPACAVVAVLAKPAVVVIFGPRWAQSAQVLAVLSVGTPFAVTYGPLSGFLQARQRYNFSMLLWVGMLIVAIPAVFLGAWWQGPLLVAVAVAGENALASPVSIYLSVRDCGMGWREVMSVFVPGLPLAALAVLPIYLLDWLWPALGRNGVANVLVGTALAGVIFFGLGAWVCRAESAEFWTRVGAIVLRVPVVRKFFGGAS